MRALASPSGSPPMWLHDHTDENPSPLAGILSDVGAISGLLWLETLTPLMVDEQVVAAAWESRGESPKF